MTPPEFSILIVPEDFVAFDKRFGWKPPIVWLDLWQKIDDRGLRTIRSHGQTFVLDSGWRRVLGLVDELALDGSAGFQRVSHGPAEPQEVLGG